MTKQSNRKNRIFFSNSLQGVKHKDPEFGYKLVQHIKSMGYDVLSEHVAAKNSNERDALFLRKTGMDRKDLKGQELWINAYKIDMDWVDEADYLIAVVDGPSHGVGMEIMRALLKEERGLNRTEILCLVNEEKLEALTWMLKGIPKKYNNFQIKTYKNLQTAIKAVESVLDSR